MKKSSPQPLERARLHPMVVSDRVGEATLFLEVNNVCLTRDGRSARDIVDFLNRYDYRTTGVLNRSSHEPHSIFAVPEFKAESIEVVRRAGVRLLPFGEGRQ